MKRITSRTPAATAVDIDALLQDSYLLVVELHQGASAQDSNALMQRCVEQVERVRRQLRHAGMSPRSIEHIGHAQCALLDETVLTCGKGDARVAWLREPLQAKFFNQHQAGEFLYDEIREVLREPAADVHVLTAFQRVLLLGFKGRYTEADHPEREQLLSALSEQVPPMNPGPGFTTLVPAGPPVAALRCLRSPWMQAMAAGLLLIGAWWGLDHLLGGLIATLLPAQP